MGCWTFTSATPLPILLETTYLASVQQRLEETLSGTLGQHSDLLLSAGTFHMLSAPVLGAAQRAQSVLGLCGRLYCASWKEQGQSLCPDYMTSNVET